MDCTNLTGITIPASVTEIEGGWGSSFDLRPPALWNPHFHASHPAFGVHSAGFGLPVVGTANIPIVLEASIGLSGET
jgi:hypothetical protein